MKKAFTICLSLLLILGLSACGSKQKGNDENKLTIWGFYEAMPKEAADYFGENNDVEIDYQTIGWGDYQTKLDTVLGTDDAPDLLILDNSFIGKYIQHEGILNLEEAFSDKEEMKGYIENTLPSTKGPGMFDGKAVAVGWESTVGAFYYRSDLAEQHLDIKTVEEMEERLSTPESLIQLQKDLDESGSGLKLIGDMKDTVAAIVSPKEPYVNGDEFILTDEVTDNLTFIKTLEDSKIYYTKDDRTAQINGALTDKYLGDIAPAWAVQAVSEYEQPGQWAIAKTPFKYTSGGSFWAMTTNANKELAWDFLSSTFINEEWLLDNLENFGSIGNEKVTLEYIEKNTDLGSEYYSGQNITKKFLEIAQDTPAPGQTSAYDSGIIDSINKGIDSYVFEKTTTTEKETIEQIITDIENLYPDLQIKTK